MIYKKEDVKIARDWEGNVIECQKANSNEKIESGNIITFCEEVEKSIFWKNYHETKKYNPHFSKYEMLRSALMCSGEYPKGFALQDDWKIKFLNNSILLNYNVKVQYGY